MADQKADPLLNDPPAGAAPVPPVSTGYVSTSAGYSHVSAGYTPPPMVTPTQAGSYEPSPNPLAPPVPQCCTVTDQPCSSRNAKTVVHSTRDHFFMMSFLSTICCCVCGTWTSLLCTVPAIFYGSAAQDAEVRADLEGVRRNGRIAMYLNVAAIVNFIVTWLVIILIVTLK
ncbi:hypothetical protein EMCRGX_G018287 [Ephydatia muelleri]